MVATTTTTSILEGKTWEKVTRKDTNKSPFISIFRGGIMVSKVSYELLGKSDYVTVWKGKDENTLALTASDKYDKNAIELHHSKTQSQHRLIDTKLRKLAESLMQRKFEGKSIRIQGEWIADEKAIIFEMKAK